MKEQGIVRQYVYASEMMVRMVGHALGFEPEAVPRPVCRGHSVVVVAARQGTVPVSQMPSRQSVEAVLPEGAWCMMSFRSMTRRERHVLMEEGVQDPLKQSQLAVALFGTQFEDLGPGVLDILSGIEGASYSSADALNQINSVKYDDLNNAMEGAKRSILNELLPTAQSMSKKAAAMCTGVIDALADGFQPDDIETIGTTVADGLLEGIGELQTIKV